jgi:NADH-quinone oxidoreductase subunit N
MGFNWTIIAPEIAILATGFVILVAGLFLKKGRNSILTAVSFIGILIALGLTFKSFSITDLSFQGMVIGDRIAFFFKIIFCLGTLLTIFASSTYVGRELKGLSEFYVLVFFATFGMMVMASSTDLITIFLGLEVMSIPLYVLAGIYRKRLRSREASMKYFFLGAFASGFFLYGIALIFGAYGSTNLVEISSRFSFAGGATTFLTLAGIALILIGLGFKVAIAPFHMWAPDVYEGAPVPATAFMSAGPKAAGFAALFRIFTVFAPVLNDYFISILWILCVLTMTWGNVLAISQKNIKRMLAYSSIAHAGYVMIALVVGGKSGFSAAMFYLLVYTIINIGAFAVVILFAGKEEKFENISDYAGFGFRYPFAGIALTIFLLSLAGIPATAGFVGKYKIFMAAINSGFYWLAIIGVINSLISVWYYIYVVVTMYMKPVEHEHPKLAFSPTLLVAVLIALILTLQLGIFPESYLKFSDLASDHLNLMTVFQSIFNSL